MRYGNSRSGAQTQALSVRINGVSLSEVALPASNNEPNWRATNWDSHRIENVTLAAGPNNTIELSTNAWYVAVDEIVVATAADLARAQPHRRVRSLPQVEQEQPLAFLRQLDGTPAPAEVDAVFADGFEP